MEPPQNTAQNNVSCSGFGRFPARDRPRNTTICSNCRSVTISTCTFPVPGRLREISLSHRSACSLLAHQRKYTLNWLISHP